MIRCAGNNSPLCGYFLFCIILEERSKMKKKLLDVTIVLSWIFILIAGCDTREVTGSNMREVGAQTIWAQVEKTAVIRVAEGGKTNQQEATGTAGISRLLVPDSFTTESDETAGIEKNDIRMVTTAKENRWGITLEEDEIELLAKIVWVEACGEPVLGQEAVVEVIFNRMASDIYPDTLYEVLSQKHPLQFCSWPLRDTAEPTEKEYNSIQEVLDGNTNILRNDTLYFSTEPLTDGIDVTIGGHSFCY